MTWSYVAKTQDATGGQCYLLTEAFLRKWSKRVSSEWIASRSVISDSLQPHGLYSPWNSIVQNFGVGSLSLLQGIFPTQELNRGLLHSGWILYQLSHKGSPRILEWVARGSSQPRNWTRIPCIASRFFTNWATREAQRMCRSLANEEGGKAAGTVMHKGP